MPKNNFDVLSHMGELKIDKERLNREVRTRTREVRILNRLVSIFKLAIKEKLTKNDQVLLEIKLKIVAKEIIQMNRGGLQIYGSGADAEVLARLVGSEILLEFPEIVAIQSSDEDKYVLNYEYKSKDEVCLHLEERFFIDGDGEMQAKRVAMSFDMDLTKGALLSRVKELKKQINALNEFSSTLLS